MPRKKTNLYKDYYFQGHLSEQDIMYLEKMLQMKYIESLLYINQESAEMFGRKYDPNLELYASQTLAVGMGWLNGKLFLGDKPGLGKTLIASSLYSLYRKKCKQSDYLPGKLLFVTDDNVLSDVYKDLEKCGINVMVLRGGTDKIKRIIKKYNIKSKDIDGVLTTWPSLKTNGFLEFYLDNREMFEVGLFDETSILKDNKTVLFGKVEKIVEIV